MSSDRVDLHRALGRLAPRHREVLVLRYATGGAEQAVTPWWSGGGKPARIKRIETGNQVPAKVAGAYSGGDW